MFIKRMSSNNWLLLILFNSLLIQGAQYMVRPMITYRLVDLGADAALVGAIGSTFALAPLFLAIPFGRWMDRGRDGAALFFGGLISVLTTAGLLFIDNIPMLAIAMPLFGVGHLLTMAGGQASIAKMSVDKKYEKNFGLLTFYASLGQALGPFIGGAMADRGLQIDTNAPILVASLLYVVSTLAILPLVSFAKAAASVASSEGSGSVRKLMGTKSFKSALFVSSAIASVVDVMLIFLPLLGRQLNFSATEVGILLAVRSGASMLIRLVLGTITDRIGMRRVINYGSFVSMLCCLALAFLQNYWALLALMLISGLAMAIGQPASMAWISRISQAQNRSLAITIRLTSNRLGQVVVPVLAGLISFGGVGSAFLMLAALQAVSLVVSSQAIPKQD